MTSLPSFSAETQAAFSVRLEAIDRLHPGFALSQTVSAMTTSNIDAELSRVVPPDALAALAAVGIRGERFFCVPAILQANPYLLAYYRLLYGISQKEFYRGSMGQFKSMEVSGRLSAKASERLDELVSAIAETGHELLSNLSGLSMGQIRDLQVLTVGQQLKGGKLNQIGQAATRLVFRRIRAAVADMAVEHETDSEVALRNASGRLVTVTFSTDPDIAVVEDLGSTTTNTLAIEIKGGTDISNVHNRLGEAEKSHQKAKQRGFREFWTILNARVSDSDVRHESPTTSLVFQLSEIIDPNHKEWLRFRDELASRLGVSASD